MPKDGKIYVKPQSLAQKKVTGYDRVKQETMDRNNEILNALGLKSIPYPFCSSQPTREGKNNVDGDESDEDFHLPENVEGLHFSSDDDEVHGSQKKKGQPSRAVAKNEAQMQPSTAMAATLQPSPSQLPQLPVIDQMQPSTATNQPQPPPIVTQKVPRRPVGAMTGTSQPSPTTSQMLPSQFVDQSQPPKAANQLHAPPSVTTELPCNPAEAMAATPQPSPTTGQIPPSKFVDQTQPPTAANQPQGPPSLTTKLPRNPAGAMAGTAQPSPIVSQVQPPPITDQMQTPPPVVSSKRSRSVESMAASRGRGPSRPHKDWGTGKKLEVVLDKYDLPIGTTAGVLQSQLGILARKANTNVPDVYKHNCLMSVGKKWKDWKDYLKRNYYDIYETDAERVANCPDRVDPNQWRILVAFWGGQLATLAAAKGGVEPDRLEVFQKTHTKKDGKPVDEASKIAIARIDERISQVPVSLQSPTYREKVFTDVLGQDTRGRVRTFGLGPCPSQVWGTRFTRSQELHDRDQLHAELRKEVLAEVDDRLSRLERKCARFEAHAKDIGYPLPPSPEDDSPISPSHNGQNGSGQSCNEEHVLDANRPQQQIGDDRSRPLRAWTDEELMYEMELS
ncbi:hypothetical protein RHMOL_Rhmol11G0054700 [Rhododendron molle]|uniref:Uncharacterized protein n=1 Tax=Rhododendron molle TaxID=49168 RepID=A0ACC0LP24_RHOML|nr:hypothetical protein RHMOL_Rhmol11G0054700 [Rhododendron molle]